MKTGHRKGLWHKPAVAAYGNEFGNYHIAFRKAAIAPRMFFTDRFGGNVEQARDQAGFIAANVSS